MLLAYLNILFSLTQTEQLHFLHYSPIFLELIIFQRYKREQLTFNLVKDFPALNNQTNTSYSFNILLKIYGHFLLFYL